MTNVLFSDTIIIVGNLHLTGEKYFFILLHPNLF